MTPRPPITIPSNLLPSDGRFGSGPSKIQQSFVTDLASTGTDLLGTSHRRKTVQSIVGGIRDQISNLYRLPDGYEVVLGVGGATAFWDAATFGLIDRQSAHFVCGEFSEKFATVTAGAPHLGEPVIVKAPYGSAPLPVAVSGVDVAAFIHNETSTGVMAPFGRHSEALVLVDGTSAAGAIPFDVTAVDAYYFSPQKALGSEGGLWLAIVSAAAIERIKTIAGSDRWIPPFLSLETALDNSRRDQTYNTPSLTTLYLLDRQLSSVLDQGGMEWAASRTMESSGLLYNWADSSTYASAFVEDPSLRSPTVVTLDFADDITADTIASVLKDNGIVDTESYRKLGRNQLRIATFPNIDPDDIAALIACIEFVVERLAG
ncbi:MAG: phosphoserine transaminase [Actinomycetota bacterium]|nr:phosphoserine transaminase [Actinomycetota bacterium]